jgi:hypothetical protein
MPRRGSCIEARLSRGTEKAAMPGTRRPILRVATPGNGGDPETGSPLPSASAGTPFSFAGLWECWQPKEDEALEAFTILTTDPNELTETVHNRMPVILEPRDYGRWMPAWAMSAIMTPRCWSRCLPQTGCTKHPALGVPRFSLTMGWFHAFLLAESHSLSLWVWSHEEQPPEVDGTGINLNSLIDSGRS